MVNPELSSSLSPGAGRIGIILAGLSFLVGGSPLACVDASVSTPGDHGIAPVVAEVEVAFSGPLRTVPPLAFGMHASVYDNALHDAELPQLLREGGLTLLRYPGGGYSDNYHWSEHIMTPFGDGGQTGYLAEGSDFGSFVSVLESFGGTAMITVNYGSNLAGDGPGEPLEAAAWVAYANGAPDDARSLGVDGSGTEWGTVGSWASLRAASPLSTDDGKNFLRIGRLEAIGIEYWEIGNEIFGNGFYGEENQFEHDGHVPYDGTPREGNPALSGATYGQGVVAYADAMKAVDPAIRIGAVLNTPPRDYVWGPDWNANVLTASGEVIDFVSVHWYPTTQASTIVAVASTELQGIARELRASFDRHCGANAANIGIAMTELGGAPGHDLLRGAPQSLAIFAADTYVTAIELGFANLDWLELHNGTYLDERTQARGPAYFGIQLAAHLASAGDTLVQTRSNRSTLVAHAATRADGSRGFLFADLNLPSAPPSQVQVSVEGAPHSTECSRTVLSVPAVDAWPELDEGAPIAVQDGTFALEVTGFSLTLVDCPP